MLDYSPKLWVIASNLPFNILLLVSDTLYSVWREGVSLETQGGVIFGFVLKNLKDLNF